MNEVWSFITSEGLFTFRESKYQWKSRCLSREHLLLSSERASSPPIAKRKKNTADSWRAQRGHHFSHSYATFFLAKLSISSLLSGLCSSLPCTSLC